MPSLTPFCHCHIFSPFAPTPQFLHEVFLFFEVPFSLFLVGLPTAVIAQVNPNMLPASTTLPGTTSPNTDSNLANVPTVLTEDWTKKDIKLPWNQIAFDKSFGINEYVVFTKSFKYKLGFISDRKERIHARWNRNTVELFIMRARDCSLLFGCESATSYPLPKRIKFTVKGQDYFLKTVEQNTYELTPEFKQAIAENSDRVVVTVDERVNFDLQEDAITGIKRLFALS